MTGTVLKKSDLWKEGSGAGDIGLDEIGNGLDGVAQLTFLHSLYVGITMIVEVMDGIQQTLRSQIIFCKNFTESLAAERFCIQNLVTSAGIGSKRDQKRRFATLQ